MSECLGAFVSVGRYVGVFVGLSVCVIEHLCVCEWIL